MRTNVNFIGNDYTYYLISMTFSWLFQLVTCAIFNKSESCRCLLSTVSTSLFWFSVASSGCKTLITSKGVETKMSPWAIIRYEGHITPRARVTKRKDVWHGRLAGLAEALQGRLWGARQGRGESAVHTGLNCPLYLQWKPYFRKSWFLGLQISIKDRRY